MTVVNLPQAKNEWKMFFEFGVPLAERATTALPPTKEEIEKLLAIAPKYGIETRLPNR